MRNNRFSLILMVALLVAVAGISSAFGPPGDRPQQSDAQKEPPKEGAQQADKESGKEPPKDAAKDGTAAGRTAQPADEDKKAADQMNNEKSAEGKATERFVPSERTTADNSATFPVDI